MLLRRRHRNSQYIKQFSFLNTDKQIFLCEKIDYMLSSCLGYIHKSKCGVKAVGHILDSLQLWVYRKGQLFQYWGTVKKSTH